MENIAFHVGRLFRMFLNWLSSLSIFQYGNLAIMVLFFIFFPKWAALLFAGGSWWFLGLRYRHAFGWILVFASWLAFSGFAAFIVACFVIYFLYVRGARGYEAEEEEGPDVFGKARWATVKDMTIGKGTPQSPKPVLNSLNQEFKGRIVLGRLQFPPAKKNQPSQQDFIVSTGEGHILTIAQTGAGKGVNVVIPNILAYDHPMVVLDPKGENFLKTHFFRESNKGQEICLIDPFGQVAKEVNGLIKKMERENNDAFDECLQYFEGLLPKVTTYGAYLKGFNPLQVIEDLIERKEYDQILDEANVIADMLVIRTPQDKDSHWNEKAKSFIRGVILFVTFAEDCQKNRQLYPLNLVTVKKVIETAFGSQDAIDKFIEKCKENPHLDGIAGTINLVAKEERGSVLSTVMRHLDFLNSLNVQESLTRNDFQLDEIRRKEKTIYLVLPADKMEAYNRLARLWIASIKTSLERINDGDRKDSPVLFMLDEIAQLGRMEPLKNAISLSRSIGIKIWMIFQDVAQMKVAYPDEEWRTFFSNTKSQQFFGISPTDIDTCEFVSKAAGQMTVQFETVSVSQSTNQGRNSSYGSSSGGDTWSSNSSSGSSSGTSHSQSYNQNFQGRPLINPDEVSHLTHEHILIFGACKYPIKSLRMPYYQMPVFSNRYPFHLEDHAKQFLEI